MTAEYVGTTVDDLAVVAQSTRWVAGLPEEQGGYRETDVDEAIAGIADTTAQVLRAGGNSGYHYIRGRDELARGRLLNLLRSCSEQRGTDTRLYITHGHPCESSAPRELRLPIGDNWSVAAVDDFRADYPSTKGPNLLLRLGRRVELAFGEKAAEMFDVLGQAVVDWPVLHRLPEQISQR